MSTSVQLGTLITEVKPIQEDLALAQLNQSRIEFKKIINDIYGVEKISIGSDSEILSFMHGFETERVDLEFSDQEKIWAQFEDYRQTFHDYQGMINDQSLETTIEELRSIDPHLVNEERYSSDDAWITKCLKTVFYEIVRLATSGAKIDRYIGRVSVLGAAQKKEQETQKVLDIFPKFFATSVRLTSLGQINRLLELCTGNRELEERRNWFENHLMFYVNPNLGQLLDRELTVPVRVIEPVVEGLEDIPTKKVQNDLVTQWADGEGAMIVETMTRATLMNEKLVNIVNTKLLPLDQIALVEQHLDDPHTFEITFKSPLVGSADSVDEGGWGDMAYSRMLMDRKLTVRFDPFKNSINFLKGGFQMGIHLEDFSFLYNKMSYTEGTALSTFLKYHGYMSTFGSLKHPMHLATTVNSLRISGDDELRLGIAIHDTSDIPLPRAGQYPKGGCLSNLQSNMDSIELTAPELEKTFKHMEWRAASQ